MPDVNQIIRDLTAAKMNYNLARMQLASHLRTYDKGKGIDAVLAEVEEYGVRHALKVMARSPANVDLHALPADIMGALELQLTKLQALSDQMDQLLTARETELRKDQPDRPPMFQVQGQEFTLDREIKHVHWVDIGRTEALTVLEKAPDPKKLRQHSLDDREHDDDD